MMTRRAHSQTHGVTRLATDVGTPGASCAGLVAHGSAGPRPRRSLRLFAISLAGACLLVGCFPLLSTRRAAGGGCARLRVYTRPATDDIRQAPPHLARADSRCMAAARTGGCASSPRLAHRHYFLALEAILYQESRYGTEPRCAPGIVGPAGERGPWQVTPIWCRDAERLTGMAVDPDDFWKTEYQVYHWLRHYAPPVAAVTVDDMCRLYREGPGGYVK